VLLVHDTVTFGGLEVMMLRMIDGLGDRFEFGVLVQAGPTESTQCPERLIIELSRRDVTLLEYNPESTGAMGFARSLWGLRQTIRAFGPSVVHVHSSRVVGAKRAQMAAWLARARVIRTEHNSPSAFGQMPLDTLSQRLIDYGVKLFTTVSLADRIEQIELVGRRSSKVVAIQNGVDILRYAPSQTFPETRADAGIPPGSPIVGGIGRFSFQKGFDVLIRAHAICVSEYHHNLVLVGDGEMLDELKNLAAELDVADSTHFIGWADDPRRWIAQFDLAVMPSRHEGLSLLFLELMAMGIAIVTSDHSSFSEAGIAGSTHESTPTEDPHALAATVTRLLGDDSARIALGQNARAHVLEHFDLAANLDRYAGLYEQIGRRSLAGTVRSSC